MSRKPRKFLNTNFFFFLLQGINKEYIFEEEICKKVYLKLLFQNYKKYNNDIISFCIMDNHLHIILYVDKIENMSNLMKYINCEYAQFYNRFKNRVGPVFRDRFKSQPIEDESYLYQCILYVHRNPVKAEIAETIDTYKYSSTMKYSLDKVNKILNKNIEVVDELGQNKFIDIEEQNENIENVIDKIIERDIKELQLNRENLKDFKVIAEIVKRIKNETNASLTVIAKKLNISKSTVHRYLKK